MAESATDTPVVAMDYKNTAGSSATELPMESEVAANFTTEGVQAYSEVAPDFTTDGLPMDSEIAVDFTTAKLKVPMDEEDAPDPFPFQSSNQHFAQEILCDDSSTPTSTETPETGKSPPQTEPKPLRSILKKRKPANDDEAVAETNKGDAGKKDAKEPVPKKPKGGSITQALKMITSMAEDSDEEEDETDPKPSAFILEMEKQKDSLPVPVPGVVSFPNRAFNINTDWQQNMPETIQPSLPVSFFQQQQQQQIIQKGKSKKKKKKKQSNPQTFHISAKESIYSKDGKDHSSKTFSSPHTEKEEGIVMINNLPFKATAKDVVLVLGVWPKDGYEGVKMIHDSIGTPAGYGYILLERRSDIMDVLRMSGFDFQGRRIKCIKSNRRNLFDDWKKTKKDIQILDKSRVVKFSQLPFTLSKEELIKIVTQATLTERDIYWSPLRKAQTNSGRGFVVCHSLEDAKIIAAQKSYRALGRKIEVCQVHPLDMERFCMQAKLEIFDDHVLTDEIDNSWDNISDLNLKPNGGPEDEYFTEPTVITKETYTVTLLTDVNSVNSKDSTKTDTKTDSSAAFATSKQSGGRLSSKRARSRRNSHDQDFGRGRDRKAQRQSSKPPFKPTIHVRMYNVPDKATTNDIQKFFEPLLPAKIAQNIGYNIYDVQFYSPDEAMQAMSKHTLLMRKNMIELELLPGPPNPLPPRPGFSGPPRNMMPSPMPPGMMPPGPMPGFAPGMVPPGMMYPGMMGPMVPGSVPPGFHPMMPQPMGMPMMPGGSMVGPGPQGPVAFGNSGKVSSSMEPSPDTKSMNMSRKTDRRKDRDTSPERFIEPKKELIPVPPLPEDFTTYVLPPYDSDKPVGQGVVTTMQGYFCQLCNKFYSSRTSAKDAHCKTKAHYDKLKQFLREKERLRKLAEADSKSK